MKKRNIIIIEEQPRPSMVMPDSMPDSTGVDTSDSCGKTDKEIIARNDDSSLPAPQSSSVVVMQRGVTIAAVACIILAAIFFVVFFSRQRDLVSDESVFKLVELEEREIISISQYNIENGTSYLCAEEDVSDGLAYSDGSRDVLLTENFYYSGVDCVLYVLTDASDKSVDVLSPFYDCFNTMQVDEREVFYDDLTLSLAYFHDGETKYFLSLEVGGKEALSAVLKYLFA